MMKVSVIPSPKSLLLQEGTASPALPVQKQVNPRLGKEAYRLTISSDQILLEGGSDTALFYGESTLEQLKLQNPEALPCLTIEDEPAYEWRSFHIDCARHFIPVEELKKMIRMAAHFKLNKFHWHLTDDQGWRIECSRYPLLHQIGSVRKGDHFGNCCSDEPEGGYYTRDEIRDVVAYCASLGIDVVPEIDMPGHVSAVLAAYPELGCTGKPIEIQTTAGIFPDIFCAGKEEVFTFIENLLDDILELFPYKYIHIGGDEAPKERWNDCPLCQKRMQELGYTDPRQLQGYVENRIAAHLHKRGRTPVVWNEAADGGNLDPDVILQLWTEDKDHRVAGHLRAGGKAVLSNFYNCYCDYPYGMISLQDVYNTNMAPDDLKGTDPELIIGTECLIWTEYVRDKDRLESYCWPRFAASAEVGWSGNGRPGYEDFTGRLENIFPIFDRYDIHATEKISWVPAPELKAQQLREFSKNFTPERAEGFLKGYGIE